MKLRDKKTGKVIEALITAYGISGDVAISVMDSNSESGYTELGRYKTLAELNEEWEDYKPIEPLIEDKEIREIIRAWANVNDAMALKYDYGENSLEDIYRNEITFNMGLGLKDGHSYTIPELCGEEE